MSTLREWWNAFRKWVKRNQAAIQFVVWVATVGWAGISTIAANIGAEIYRLEPVEAIYKESAAPTSVAGQGVAEFKATCPNSDRAIAWMILATGTGLPLSYPAVPTMAGDVTVGYTISAINGAGKNTPGGNSNFTLQLTCESSHTLIARWLLGLFGNKRS